MSESATEQTQQQPTDATQGNPDDAADLGDAGKKAIDTMKGERNAARAEAAQLKAQLDAINQANETALEKAQRETKEAQEQALRAGTDALRFRIAAESGITDNVDLILTAPDEETMRRQAELWSSRPTQASTSPAGPRPDLSQGSKGADNTDPKAAFGRLLQEMPG